MKTEEYVLQFATSYDHDYLSVRGEDGGYSTSSYMSDVKHYDSLKLARLAVEAFHCRYDMPIKIIRISLEEVEIIKRKEHDN